MPTPLNGLMDMLSGQMMAAQGVDVNAMRKMLEDNRIRLSRTLEAPPAGMPPGNENPFLSAAVPISSQSSFFCEANESLLKREEPRFSGDVIADLPSSISLCIGFLGQKERRGLMGSDSWA
jgi:hypothetical protein